jgi:hypothetical protein
MALRTFRSNPALGGFGGESSAPLVNRTGNAAIRVVDCDAFAQIIKELVDNAVDACSVNTHGNTDTNNNTCTASGGVKKKRVRVSIERVNLSKDDSDSDDEDETESSSNSGRHQAARNQASLASGKQEILRVTVLDNGCGMNDIQASVDAFHTSKAHAARSNQDNVSDYDDNEDNNQYSSTARGEGRTAGRYGIGLTLCLLHAQRLVPNSCATIKSATANAAHYDFVTCVVDTEGDSVRCIRRQQLPKSFADESGTAVSVLVPVSCGPGNDYDMKCCAIGRKGMLYTRDTNGISLYVLTRPVNLSFLLTGRRYSHAGLATSSRVFCSIQTKPGSTV